MTDAQLHPEVSRRDGAYRVAIWTPMPPARSGIADYSAELVAALRPRCEVAVFTDPDAVVSYGETNEPVYPYSMFEQRHAESPFDLNVYHMGNSGRHHGEIYERLLQQPGIVVLHDATLFDFYWAHLVDADHAERFLDEVEYNYGPETRALMPLYFQEKITLDHLAVHMMRRTIEASTAVVVHSAWAQERFGRLFPHRSIVHIPMGTPLLESSVGNTLRDQHGWGPETLVVGVFGGWSRAKRIHVVVDAFVRVYHDHPEMRLLLAGRVDDPSYAKQIRETIRDAGLEDAVLIVHELPFDAFERHLAAVDLVVNLRWPSVGETSATLVRAFGAGKVVIASDVPQVLEWERQFCWPVPRQGKDEVRRLAQYLADAATHLAELRRAGDSARDSIRATASWDVVAQQYVSLIDRVLAWYSPDETPPTPVEDERAPGLTIIGDLTVAGGVGEAANSMVSAIMSGGIPTSYIELKAASDRQLFGIKPREFRSIPTGSLYPINLLLRNINEMHTVGQREWAEARRAKYTVASWFYELPQVPDRWLDAFDRVDEIWAPSQYTRASMLTVARVPVTLIPVPVEVKTSPTPNRGTFSIPRDRYVFYCSFSAASCSGRKNPWGVIDAFERAFGAPDNGGPLLVMKVHYLDRYPVLQEALRAAMDGVNGMLIERSFSRQQTNDLLACADAYISLHRSEGFGLGMAESMYLGKPVIGTYHSGNVDFMNEQNSFPVRCTLRPITLDDHRYQPECANVYEPGRLWAEPDLEHAASHLQYVYDHQEAAWQVGRRAAGDIRAYCSPSAVGQAIEARLLQLGVPATSTNRGEEVGAYGAGD